MKMARGNWRELTARKRDRHGNPTAVITTRMRASGKGKCRPVKIATMVAAAWVPRPSPRHLFVYSLDGDLENVAASNLAWKPNARGRMAGGKGRPPLVTLPRLIKVLQAINDGASTNKKIRAATGLSENAAGVCVGKAADEGWIAREQSWLPPQLTESGRLARVQLEACALERKALHFLAARSKGRDRQVRLRDRYDVLASGCCAVCGRTVSRHGAVLHVDHIVPISRGGTDDRFNLQALCDLCNLGKSNRYAGDRLLTPARP